MNQKLRVQVSAKRSLKDRTDLASLIAKKAPNSTFVQAHLSLKASCDALIQAGVDLDTALTDERAAKTAYAEARSLVRAKTTAYDGSHDVCVAQTELYVTTPEEMQSVGWTVAVQSKYLLTSPLQVLPSYDILKSLIHIEVRQPPGMRACIIEISPDPVTPTSWVRLDGNGIRRTLSGYPPGVYWIRVANVRAHAKSAYTDPVSVTVK